MNTRQSFPSRALNHRPNANRMTLAGATTRATAGALLLFLLGCSTTSVTKVEVRERKDSLVVHFDTVRVLTISDSVRIDTVRVAGETLFRGVKAHLDTTVSGTTMKLSYELPPDAWRVEIAQRDTFVRWIVRDSIVQRPYKVEVVPFWVYLALGGMALAMLIAGTFALRKSN